jgi:hypothetical protein
MNKEKLLTSWCLGHIGDDIIDVFMLSNSFKVHFNANL